MICCSHVTYDRAPPAGLASSLSGRKLRQGFHFSLGEWCEGLVNSGELLFLVRNLLHDTPACSTEVYSEWFSGRGMDRHARLAVGLHPLTKLVLLRLLVCRSLLLVASWLLLVKLLPFPCALQSLALVFHKSRGLQQTGACLHQMFIRISLPH